MPPKTKQQPAFKCTECGAASLKWFGQCPECQAWGTLVDRFGVRWLIGYEDGALRYEA